MIAAAFAFALAFTAPIVAGPESIEAALERQTTAFEETLDTAVSHIEAELVAPGSLEQRRSRAKARIAALTSVINDYSAYVRSVFTALGEGESAQRAAEYRDYSEGFTRYLNGLPTELARSVDEELAQDP